MFSIYIDGLFYKGSGIGRYYESLVKEFAKRGIKIYTCIPEKLKYEFEKDFSDVIYNITPISVNYEKFSVRGFWFQSRILKNLEDKVDLFFYPHINIPFYMPKNTIVVIHDLIPLTRFWDGNKIKKIMFYCNLYRAIKNAKKIITVSNYVAETLKNKFNIKMYSRINVIYEFVDDKFYEHPKIVKNSLIDGDYILFVGNRKKHKNLRNLILAYNQIRHRINIKLVIAGPKTNKDVVDNLVQKLKLKDKIIEVISPSDDTLLKLYIHAKLFVFPSFIEGFGLPPLEAIASGCPTITSNIQVLREILGEKIACFNPYNVNDIADKIYKTLTNNALRDEILKDGKRRLSNYSKDMIVSKYIRCFEEIVE